MKTNFLARVSRSNRLRIGACGAAVLLLAVGVPVWESPRANNISSANFLIANPTTNFDTAPPSSAEKDLSGRPMNAAELKPSVGQLAELKLKDGALYFRELQRMQHAENNDPVLEIPQNPAERRALARARVKEKLLSRLEKSGQ